MREKLAYPRGSVRMDATTGRMVRTKPPLPTSTNLEIIIGQDPLFYPFIGFNEFTGQVTWNSEEITDTLETGVALQIAAVYEINVSTERVREILHYIAHEHKYHPVREWLAGLVWDGTPRIDGLLADYAGVDPSALTTAISRKWMIGAVARVFDPGCQLDTTLILVGSQGAGKSTFFRSLVPRPDWFSDTAMDLKSKDAFQQLQGTWIYEVAELSALRARDAESVKAFLTARWDRYRPPYGRNTIRVARQVAFVGTTNEAEFLDDPTGARRFWPVRVGTIDIARVDADRAQLWAEAAEAYQYGDRQWHLTAEESVALGEAHRAYERTDPWKGIIEDYAKGRVSVSVWDVMNGALDLDAKDQHKAAVMRVTGLLGALGYEKRRARDGEKREYRWHMPEARYAASLFGDR